MSAFAICPTSLISDRRLTLTDTRTLLGLLSFTQPDRLICWPSRRTLAERIGVSSLARISQTIARLENLGWLAVTRREGSSLYQITPPDPDTGATPRTVGGATPRTVPPEETIEFTKIPPNPQGGECQSATETQLPTPEPQLLASVPQLETPEPQEPTPAPTVAEPVTPQLADSTPTVTEPTPAPAPTVADAQAIVEHLNQVTGSRLPTHGNAAIVRSVTKRLKHFSSEEIKNAISHGAKAFRIPSAMLKPSILESLISQVRADKARHSARIAQERDLIASLRPAAPSTPETAKTALTGLRRLLR